MTTAFNELADGILALMEWRGETLRTLSWKLGSKGPTAGKQARGMVARTRSGGIRLKTLAGLCELLGAELRIELVATPSNQGDPQND